MRFLLAIHKDADSSYGVTVPDVPGCFSAGETLDEAITNAADAIAGHLSILLDAGEPLPLIQPFEEHQTNSDYESAIWAYTEVDLEQLSDKAERVNISLPRRVLWMIDRHTQGRESRSGFLARAALKVISEDMRSTNP